MQQIPRELNLSECTYVLPPDDPANQFKVRIFTPAQELPMAGHPTIGTGFVLARMGLIPSGNVVTIRLEEGVGVIPVEIRSKGGQPDLILMDQPLPTFGEVYADRDALAALLGIDAAGLDARYPAQIVSSGVPFLFIPIIDLATMRQLRLRMDVWERQFRDAALGFFMFTQEAERPASTVHCRMFAPAAGVAEDPATGAAHGPLGGYLIKYGIVGGDQVTFLSEQGVEMGRPSLITVMVESRDGAISRVRVGGQCQSIGEGFIEA
jgi:trans-2,3-dihydro-3-hydroxyanthranilate isomerase